MVDPFSYYNSEARSLVHTMWDSLVMVLDEMLKDSDGSPGRTEARSSDLLIGASLAILPYALPAKNDGSPGRAYWEANSHAFCVVSTSTLSRPPR